MSSLFPHKEKTLLTPSTDDIKIYLKYFNDTKVRKSAVDLVFECNSPVDLGAVAAVMCVGRDAEDYYKFRTMPFEDVKACIKVILHKYPSNPSLDLEWMSKYFRMGNPSRIGELNAFLADVVPKYSHLRGYEVEELYDVEKSFLKFGKELTRDNLKLVNSIADDLIPYMYNKSILPRHYGKNTLCCISGDGSVFKVFNILPDSKRCVLSVDLDSCEVFAQMSKLTPGVSKKFYNYMSSFIDNVSSKIPFTVDKFYFYPIDRYSEFELHPNWVQGYIASKNGMYDLLLI